MKSPLLLFILAVTTATAQRPDVFSIWDRNQDGKLSREELPEGVRKNFDRIDSDKDGSISKAEHEAAATRMSQRGNAPARPATRPLPENVEAKLDIPYAATENPRQMLDLYLPKKRGTDKPLPVVVFIHGGGWKAGDKSGGIGNVGRFVSSGNYVGVSVGYRLTDEAPWPAQIHDCKAAIRWIKGNAGELGLDATKIAVWGSSAGGHLVSFLGTSGDVKELEGTLGKFTDQDSKVTCVVNFFGPENFITMVTQESTIDRTTANYPEALLLSGRVQDKPEVAREASPITHVSAGDAPVLTAHGTKDPLVPYAQSPAVLTPSGAVNPLTSPPPPSSTRQALPAASRRECGGCGRVRFR
jgi:acetyl esterase/lipase